MKIEASTNKYSVTPSSRVTAKVISVTLVPIVEVTMVAGEMAVGPGKQALLNMRKNAAIIQ